jgi:hypothetical protein
LYHDRSWLVSVVFLLYWRRYLQHLDAIDQLDIEKILSDVFDQATEIIECLEISNLLLERNLFYLNSLSNYVFQQIKSNSKLFNHSAQATGGGSDESSLDEDESERIDENNLSAAKMMICMRKFVLLQKKTTMTMVSKPLKQILMA